MKLDIKRGRIEFPKAERRKVHDVAELLAAASIHEPKYKPAAESLKAALLLVGPVGEADAPKK